MDAQETLFEAEPAPLPQGDSTPLAERMRPRTLDKEFDLKPAPAADGLEWVQATPRIKDGPIQWLRVGFKGTTLAALEIADAFGQRSLLRFTALEQNVKLPDSTFEFTPPKGADVIAQ